MTERIVVLFLYLVIYSFVGWLIETIYCSVLAGHFVERGFLNGPICPIYGFGALFILSVLYPYTNNIFAVFILGMISTSTLEYFTSFLMEKLFKMKWWDYSEHKFNIKGRICLLNSVLFGILCIVLTEWLHPFIFSLVNTIPIRLKYVTAAGIFIVIVVDLILSVQSVLNLKEKFEQIYTLREQIHEVLVQENLAKKLENLRESRDNFIENMLEDLKEFKWNLSELKENIDFDKLKLPLYEKLRNLQIGNRYNERRILRSFPKLKSIKHSETLQEIQKYLKEFREEYAKKKKDQDQDC